MQILKHDTDSIDLLKVVSDYVRNGTMAMITIYEKPTDYPTKFVARVFTVNSSGAQATNFVKITDGLTDMRAAFGSLMRLDRQPSDDPKIVEVYL